MSLAAKELHVAQTALGIQIRNLEEDLGAPLLERHSRGVRPTAAGELLNRHAEDILARIAAARRAVRAVSASGAEVVTMGVTPSIVRLMGDEIVTGLAAMVPRVTLHLVEDFSFVQMRRLQQGDLDCALTFSFSADPRFRRRALLEEDLFFLEKRDRAEGEGPISFREAMAHELALTGREDVVTRTLREIAARIGTELNVAYEVQSIRAVKNLVSKGVAAAVMPWGGGGERNPQGRFRGAADLFARRGPHAGLRLAVRPGRRAQRGGVWRLHRRGGRQAVCRRGTDHPAARLMHGARAGGSVGLGGLERDARQVAALDAEPFKLRIRHRGEVQVDLVGAVAAEEAEEAEIAPGGEGFHDVVDSRGGGSCHGGHGAILSFLLGKCRLLPPK